MPLTFKIKARRYPRWHYGTAAVLSVLGSTFWAWVAHSALGFPLVGAWQVFFVFSGLSLFFLAVMYVAYEKQFRDHSSRAVPKVASGFAAAMALSTLYFIAKYDVGQGRSTAKSVPIILSVACVAIGVIISIFVIQYEVE